jgi:hypothetical protein
VLREFQDDAGQRWRVWDVHPEDPHLLDQLADERRTRDRRKILTLDWENEERRSWRERRARKIDAKPIGRGWLAFESETERRRLSPIPAGWETAPHDQLTVWLAAAQRAPTTLEWKQRPFH